MAARVEAPAPSVARLTAVPTYDNPAGRLHELLRRFNERSNNNILDAWSYALDVEPHEVRHYLGSVATLVEGTKRAATETGQATFEEVPQQLDSLTETIFPTQHAWVGPPASGIAPDALLLQALDMLNRYLHQNSPEATLPNENEVDALKEEVRDLIQAVTDANLPPEVKRPLLQRLAEVLEAMEHLNLGGPEGVRLAAEALAASAVIYEEAARTDPATFERIRSFAVKAWVVFAAGSVIGNAALGWENLVHGHLAPPAQVQPAALPAGPPPTGSPARTDEERTRPG
jgi:hypothetical protein